MRRRIDAIERFVIILTKNSSRMRRSLAEILRSINFQAGREIHTPKFVANLVVILVGN